MYTYEIIVQFANPDAPSFDAVFGQIEKAVATYNAKSRLAQNPKEILTYRVADGGRSLRIVLRSERELPEETAPRALRVFSVCLLSEELEGNFVPYLSGKRLFRMSAKRLTSAECTGDSAEAARPAVQGVDGILLMQKVADALLKAAMGDRAAGAKVAALVRVLDD